MGQVMSQGEAPPPVVLVPPLFERDLRLRVSYTCMPQCALPYFVYLFMSGSSGWSAATADDQITFC